MQGPKKQAPAEQEKELAPDTGEACLLVILPDQPARRVRINLAESGDQEVLKWVSAYGIELKAPILVNCSYLPLY